MLMVIGMLHIQLVHFSDNRVGDVIPLVKAKIKSHKVENGLNYNIVSHVKVPKEKKPKSK